MVKLTSYDQLALVHESINEIQRAFEKFDNKYRPITLYSKSDFLSSKKLPKNLTLIRLT